MSSETFHADDSFHVGRLQNLGFVIWFETPTLNRVKLVAQTLPRLEQQPNTGFAMMAVVTPACAPVGADIRAEFDDAMRAHREAALGMAAVIEVTGVLGGLTRAIARTLSVVNRSPYPLTTFTSVADAAAWLPDIMTQRGAPSIESQRIIDEIAAHYR
ncbi:MAG: hypothetical protein AB1Z98_24775 [Nannocystaceae bacterium]